MSAAAVDSPESLERVDPIAIVGVGCRFPGANGPREYWELIREGRCAVREVPEHRVELGFNIHDVLDPRPGTPGKIASPLYGFVDHPELFDPTAFGLTPRDAVGMEPQQRLVVEVVWDALADAGIPVESLEGERVAVMIGHMAEDYSREQIAVLGEEDALSGQRLVAHVVLLGEARDARAALEQHARARLAAYKQPRRYVFHAELPKSPLGKLLREALR